jgi:pimeloyl-ACP methyl ester carboxylesterase
MTSGGSDADKVAALTALTPAADPLTLHRRFALLQRCDPEVLTWAIEHRLAGGLRLETLFPQIACPVLLIQCNPALGGALDDRLAQAAATYLPNCVHLYMPDVGHSIHREQPITLAQRVTDFIETIHG